MRVKLAVMTDDTKFRFLTLENPIILPGKSYCDMEIHHDNTVDSLIIPDEVAVHFFECYKNLGEQKMDMTILVIADEIVGMNEGLTKDSELITKLYLINSEKDIKTIHSQCLFKFRKNNKNDIEYFIPTLYIENSNKAYYWTNSKNKNIKVLLGHKQEVGWQ